MIVAAHDDLIEGGVVTPVDLGGPDERLWLDCDLASLAENRLGDGTDPHALDDARRAHWQAHVTTERAYPLRSRVSYERCYWLLEGPERVGTVAVATSTLGGRAARIASLYVFPAQRGRGVGGRALDRLRRTLADRGLGLKLDTSWTWQRTVRFYVRAGMWVHMWKRDLQLVGYPDTPPPRIEIGENEASLSVPVGKRSVVLARARRSGSSLELTEPAGRLERNPRIGEAYWLATSTLALSLALAGWPLVRSPEEWEDAHYADAGPPEALAYKIAIWEAWDTHHGWRVETPRIPGLEYPTWTELEARWEAKSAELEAEIVRKE